MTRYRGLTVRDISEMTAKQQSALLLVGPSVTEYDSLQEYLRHHG